jgi:hypothetical protein
VSLSAFVSRVSFFLKLEGHSYRLPSASNGAYFELLVCQRIGCRCPEPGQGLSMCCVVGVCYDSDSFLLQYWDFVHVHFRGTANNICVI